ncbi:hypothetical protein FA95DRAFT_1575179 [Auriscalpium vulgare]|uniref:Uncharacterized protein n=1 Tax=Auriscalpium vulgare TaxID=40419 RepID=A0ACB8RI42_9AGAM|nr:hypothetical protein FA95DRAFT_1575179 [Auriscalpium vulgare]
MEGFSELANWNGARTSRQDDTRPQSIQSVVLANADSTGSASDALLAAEVRWDVQDNSSDDNRVQSSSRSARAQSQPAGAASASTSPPRPNYLDHHHSHKVEPVVSEHQDVPERRIPTSPSPYQTSTQPVNTNLSPVPDASRTSALLSTEDLGFQLELRVRSRSPPKSSRTSEADVTQLLTAKERFQSSLPITPKANSPTPLFLPSASPLTPPPNHPIASFPTPHKLYHGRASSPISISSSSPTPPSASKPCRASIPPRARVVPAHRAYVAIPTLPGHRSRTSYAPLMDRPVPSRGRVADNTGTKSLARLMQAAFHQNTGPVAGPSRTVTKRRRVQSDSEESVTLEKKRPRLSYKTPRVTAVAGPSRTKPEPVASSSWLPDEDFIPLLGLSEPSRRDMPTGALSVVVRHVDLYLSAPRKRSSIWFSRKTVACSSEECWTPPSEADPKGKRRQINDSEDFAVTHDAPQLIPLKRSASPSQRAPTPAKKQALVARSPSHEEPSQVQGDFELPPSMPSPVSANRFPDAIRPHHLTSAYQLSYPHDRHPDGPMLGFVSFDGDDSELSVHMGRADLGRDDSGMGDDMHLVPGDPMAFDGDRGLPWDQSLMFAPAVGMSLEDGHGHGGTIDMLMLDDGDVIQRDMLPAIDPVTSPPPTTSPSDEYQRQTSPSSRETSPDEPLAALVKSRPVDVAAISNGPPKRKPPKSHPRQEQDQSEPEAGPSTLIGTSQILEEPDSAVTTPIELPADDEDDDDYDPRASYGPRTTKRRRKSSAKALLLQEEAALRSKRVAHDLDETFCHHCRRTTKLLKMDCANVRPKTGTCGKHFCINCIEKRYPEIAFDHSMSDFICPACSDTCRCTVCSKKRGVEYVYERQRKHMQLDLGSDQKHTEKAPMAAIASSSSAPLRVVAPKTGAFSVDTTLHKGQYWGAVFSITGQPLGMAYAEDDENLRLTATAPPLVQGPDGLPYLQLPPTSLVGPSTAGPAPSLPIPNEGTPSSFVAQSPRRRKTLHVFVGAKQKGWSRPKQVKDGVKTVPNKTKPFPGLRLYIGKRPPRLLRPEAVSGDGEEHGIEVEVPSSPLSPLEDEIEDFWPNEVPMDALERAGIPIVATTASEGAVGAEGEKETPSHWDGEMLTRILQFQPLPPLPAPSTSALPLPSIP